LSSFSLFVPQVHVNCQQALSPPDVWDPFTRAPTEDDIDGYTSALFGVQV
jgi:hypothetical protein